MRLLPERHDHGRRRASCENAQPDRRSDRLGNYEYLPLRNLSPRAQRHSSCCWQQGVEGAIMTASVQVSRRGFVAGAATAMAGLTLGFRIPFEAFSAVAETMPDE